jgi:hypothetical protein
MKGDDDVGLTGARVEGRSGLRGGVDWLESNLGSEGCEGVLMKKACLLEMPLTPCLFL